MINFLLKNPSLYRFYQKTVRAKYDEYDFFRFIFKQSNFKNIRITLDQNIEFKRYSKFINKSTFYNKCNLVVAEIKYSSKNQLSKLFDELPFEKTRFSKYCIGLETLNLI